MSADPADDFAVLLEPLLRKVLDAADPALVDVTFFGAFVWDSADPAADFAALLEPLLLNTFEAAEAAFFPVTSFLAISLHLRFLSKFSPYINWGRVVENKERYER